MRSFGDSIYNGKISIDKIEMHQSNLFDNLTDFHDRSRQNTTKGRNKTRNTYKSAYAI